MTSKQYCFEVYVQITEKNMQIARSKTIIGL